MRQTPPRVGLRTPKGMVPTHMANQLISLVDEGLAKFNQALDQI